MLRLLLLAACAAPAAALPFGFGRRKGEVFASLHEIEADLADLETETVPATNTVPVAATNTVPVPPCGELPLATSFTPPRTHVVTFKAGLTAQTTAVQTNPVPAVDTSSTGVQTGGALVSDTV